MNWRTPAEELPDRNKEGIAAWFDGQVTYHNYLNHLNWDKVKYWSYMPEHPDNTCPKNEEK